MTDNRPSSNCHLTVPTRTWERFRQAMLEARTDREEVLGFLFCATHRISRCQQRLLPKVWVVPGQDCYEHQSAGGLALRQEYNWHLFASYIEQGLQPVHVHTHPQSGLPDFSGIDDYHESKYASFLSGVRRQPRLVSGVFDENLHQGQFRIWQDGQPQSIQFTAGDFSAAVAGQSAATEERFDRQRVFGTGVQRALGELSVGLVGCGGIGAVFADQLARLGVRHWVLVDADHVETSNLNRLPGATPRMAHEKWPKVRYAKGLIKQAWPHNSQVTALTMPVEAELAQRQLAACDLLVVATDNHYSRLAAQELALRYVRPLVCLGSYLDIDESRQSVRMLCRVTIPPVDGGWCLCCQNIISPTQAAAETASDEMSQMFRQAGYLPGVAAPAVYWLNASCASLGVYAIHAAMAHLEPVSDGLDWIVDFASHNWLPVTHEPDSNCLYCSPEGLYAVGDGYAGQSV